MRRQDLCQLTAHSLARCPYAVRPRGACVLYVPGCHTARRIGRMNALRRGLAMQHPGARSDGRAPSQGIT